jgi:hypothetical protein
MRLVAGDTYREKVATSMPVLHRREDGSGFYIRARFGDSMVTYQLSPEGERWLCARNYKGGEAIDGEVFDYLRDRGVIYTEGGGPGQIDFDLESGALVAPRKDTWVKHPEFGVGTIIEDLGKGRCRVAFLKDAGPDARDVATSELRRPTSLEVAREQTLAWRRQESARTREAKSKRSVPPAHVSDVAAVPLVPVDPTGAPTARRRPTGCLALLAMLAPMLFMCALVLKE